MNKILNWMAWGIVILFYGAFVLGLFIGLAMAFGWGILLIILAMAAVFWATARVMERV